MGLGDFHKSRRWASTFALVGVLLYTALIPGHVISQATASMFAGAPGTAMEMICHDGVAETRGPSTPGEPSTPEKKCPFCKGYAPFMTALAGACDTGTLEAERTTSHVAVMNDGIVTRVAMRPHNRGPPHEL